jgi:coenzyme F420-reducing hydrogenase gamma subunit
MKAATVAVVHLGGCDRCAWHLLEASSWRNTDLVFHSLVDRKKDPSKIPGMDVLVLTGFADETKRHLLNVLRSKAKRVVAFGTCPYTGGVFGLLNQKGAGVIPVSKAIDLDAVVQGCPPATEAMQDVVMGKKTATPTPLCASCHRKMQKGNIEKINRLPDLNDTLTCFNNQGLPCSGVVSAECSQRCIDFQTPCRGCVASMSDPVPGMIGYFGALAAKLEVDTVATGWTTDRLGDRPDAITEGLVDVVGTFFRFHLASACSRAGLIPSSGDILSDIMVGRALEEAPQIAATIYGSYGVSVALNLAQGYEKATGYTASPELSDLRAQLRTAQKKWADLRASPSADEFNDVVRSIRSLAGNEVLSNVYFNGYRTPMGSVAYGFDKYRSSHFESRAVSSSFSDDFSSVIFTTDEKGIIREWSCELRHA